MTLRSHDQFNTAVYSNNDRYRGVSGERLVVFMNEQDIAALGLSEGSVIEFTSTAGDGIERRVGGFKVVAYDVPPGCCAAYYPASPCRSKGPSTANTRCHRVVEQDNGPKTTS
ncbi:molybdopterin dinucleotide binding domain-containing protein [Microvirga sp. Mcv34]|uniref:molybdopterin dinucleotide binding domain-containing protein n=1 Tax=Microvirga sp. Mcv34 TaxID=2926016 RepID=UPI0021C72E74|nr:molybdopterin dinucleotide binding domain-containing protein [Microvirga sp. Mcv34]